MNKNQNFLKTYNLDEIEKILKSDERLVYLRTSLEEVVVKYKDLPDAIVDINLKFGPSDITVYEYNNPFVPALLTTCGMFLDHCNPDVRRDIIDRLIKLQTFEENVKDYKVINEDMLDIVRSRLSNELER